MDKKEKKNLYFLALVLPEPFQSRITDFKHEAALHFQASHALNSPAHITLIPPFFATNEQMEKFIRSFREFLKNKSLSPIHLKGFGKFGNRVIFVDVIKNPALNKFQQGLFDLFKKHFPSYKKSNRFHPHVTIAFRDLKQELFDVAWDYFSAMEFEGKFTPNGVEILKHDGKKWHIVERIEF